MEDNFHDKAKRCVCFVFLLLLVSVCVVLVDMHESFSGNSIEFFLRHDGLTSGGKWVVNYSLDEIEK